MIFYFCLIQLILGQVTLYANSTKHLDVKGVYASEGQNFAILFEFTGSFQTYCDSNKCEESVGLIESKGMSPEI